MSKPKASCDGLEIQPACSDFGPEWESVDETRKLESLIGASLGPADAVCGLLTFTDGTFEVGIGECIRGYEQLYKGDDLTKASAVWLGWCEQYREE